MKIYIVVAAVLIAAGIFALLYGQFTYTKDSETATLGPIVLTVQEKETFRLPDWAGVTAIVLGGGVLAFPLLKRQYG